MRHGFIEFTCHQSFGHGLFSPLPEKQSHLLALHENSPHHQLMEGVLESTDLWVINVNIDFFLFLLLRLLSAFRSWVIVLSKQSEVIVSINRLLQVLTVKFLCGCVRESRLYILILNTYKKSAFFNVLVAYLHTQEFQSFGLKENRKREQTFFSPWKSLGWPL